MTAGGNDSVALILVLYPFGKRFIFKAVGPPVNSGDNILVSQPAQGVLDCAGGNGLFKPQACAQRSANGDPLSIGLPTRDE